MNECPQLSRVHISFRTMPSLEHLSFEDCLALKKFSHSTGTTPHPFANLTYVSFKRDDSLLFSSFAQLWKGLTDSGYTVSSTVTSVSPSPEAGENSSKTCCIKVDDCWTMFAESRKKKTSGAAIFIHTNNNTVG